MEQYSCSERTATLVIRALLRDNEAFPLAKVRIGGTKYTGVKPLSYDQQVLKAMGGKQWFVQDLAYAMNMSRHFMDKQLAKMLDAGLVGKIPSGKHPQHFYWFAKEVAEPTGEIVALSEKETRELMRLVSNQWKGTWLQGMEAVL